VIGKITGRTLLSVLLFASFLSQAQHQELNDDPTTWKEKDHKSILDSQSVLFAFKHGNVSGHFRYFFMETNNEGSLTDYFANAAGGGLKFETAKFHGFQLGLSGFYIFNIGSSDLRPDTLLNQNNRYELALFDINDPDNKFNIDRLEELYLNYSNKKYQITFGKQLINTPFINLQDGRMRPTEVEGVWTEINALKNTKLEGGILYRISPRGTVEYFSIEESIGVLSGGVNPDGSKSNYKNNLHSRGIAAIGITRQMNRFFQMRLWNVFVENIFNTSMAQLEHEKTLKAGGKLTLGFQAIYQTSVNQGGNSDPSKTYFANGGQSLVYGGKLGWTRKKWDASLNYTRITDKGRYLMPREWGRDPFYTFMARERNEGLGDVHAVVGRLGYALPKHRVKGNLALGYFDLPSVTNYALNKYGMPSFTQVNLDFRYEFNGLLKGLEAQALLVHKMSSLNGLESRYTLNKVDMTNINLIFNFYF